MTTIRTEQIAARDAILGGNDTHLTRLWLADWIWEEVLEMPENVGELTGKCEKIEVSGAVLVAPPQTRSTDLRRIECHRNL